MKLIDADKVIKKLREHKKLFCRNQIEFSMLPLDQKARVDEIEACIGELINAEPIEQHWIPVTERLPEKNGRYYVTEWIYSMDDKKHNGKHWAKTDTAEYSVKEKRWIRGAFIEVVAWMNNEPYRG